LAPGHHGVGRFKEVHQPVRLQHRWVFAGAGFKEQGHAADALGDSVDTGIDPDVLPVGLGQLVGELGGEMVGRKEKQTSGLRKIRRFTGRYRGIAPQCR